MLSLVLFVPLGKCRSPLSVSASGAVRDVRDLLPILERLWSGSGLDDEEARHLVVYGTAWPHWWASKALDWVDQGVWGGDVASSSERRASG